MGPCLFVFSSFFLFFLVLLQANVPGVPEGAERPFYLPAVWDHGLPQRGLLQVQDRYVLVIGHLPVLIKI